MKPFRRAKGDATLTDDAVDGSQVVGQLMFAAEEDGVTTIDVVALSVRHPSGRSAPGSAFELRLRVPHDPTWGSMLGRILSRWAEQNRVIGLDFGASQPPVVTLRSTECTMRLDLITDDRY